MAEVDAEFEAKMKYKITAIEKRKEKREETISKVGFFVKFDFLSFKVACTFRIFFFFRYHKPYDWSPTTSTNCLINLLQAMIC